MIGITGPLRGEVDSSHQELISSCSHIMQVIWQELLWDLSIMGQTVRARVVHVRWNNVSLNGITTECQVTTKTENNNSWSWSHFLTAVLIAN